MSILAPVLDPLVDAYVPSARTNETLKNDLLAHCQDILKRYTYSYSCLIGIQ
jgi:gamma-tubulin complex component 3